MGDNLRDVLQKCPQLRNRIGTDPGCAYQEAANYLRREGWVNMSEVVEIIMDEVQVSTANAPLSPIIFLGKTTERLRALANKD